MRNRILAGLGVAALATVGVATPATAFDPGTADLYIVHAFPALATAGDTNVDIFIDDASIATDVAPETVAGPGLTGSGQANIAGLGNLPPKTYQVRIQTTTGATVLYDEAVPLEANKAYTAVAHPTVGTPGIDRFTVSLFENQTTAAAGNGVVTVRHTANVDPVFLFSDTTELGGPLGNPDEAVLEVPAATYPNVFASLSQSTPAAAIEVGDVPLPAGTNIFVHAFGPDLDGEFRPIVYSVGGLTLPTGVPGGTAGLVDEGAPVSGIALGGVAALMLALMAAVAVVVRRRSVSVER